MSMVGHWRLAAALNACLLVAVAAPSLARAQDAAKAERNAARDSYNRGTAAYDRGDYVTALDAFVQANAIIPSAQASFWIARCQDHMGKAEAAVEAYEQLMGRADFTKLSEDKQVTARERLAALKPPAPAPVPPPPPPPPPPVEQQQQQQPAAQQQQQPPPPPVPPVPREKQLLPYDGMAELGIVGGALWLSKHHNLAGPGEYPRAALYPVWEAGVRGGYYPSKYLGVELEWLHGAGKLKPPGEEEERTLKTDILRAHVVGQLPTYFIVPYAVLGTGFIHGSSNIDGNDADLLFDAGIGAKVMSTKLLVPRIDLRFNVTQEEGGGMTDGIAVSPELMLGLDFVLNR